MDTKDLVLLLAGAFIGFVTSIFANWSTDSLWRVFTRTRAGMVERSKKFAFWEYKELKSLHSGDRDRILYFVDWSLRIQMFLAFGLFFCVLAVIVIVSALPAMIYRPAVVFVLLLAQWYIFRAVSGWLRLAVWRERLDDFNGYVGHLSRRHGEPP